MARNAQFSNIFHFSGSRKSWEACNVSKRTCWELGGGVITDKSDKKESTVIHWREQGGQVDEMKSVQVKLLMADIFIVLQAGIDTHTNILTKQVT